MKAFQRGLLVAAIAVAVSVVVKVRSKGPVPPDQRRRVARAAGPRLPVSRVCDTVLVAGLGEVGVRAARQLIDTPGVDRVIVAARRLEHAREVAAALHDGAEPFAARTRRSAARRRRRDRRRAPRRRRRRARASRRRCGHPVRVRRPTATPRCARCSRSTPRRDAHGVQRRRGMRARARPHRRARPSRGGRARRGRRAARRTLGRRRERVGEPKRGAAQREEAREWRDGELVHEKHRHAELIWYPDPGRRARVRAGRHRRRAARRRQPRRRAGHRPPRRAADRALHAARSARSRRAAGARCGSRRGAGGGPRAPRWSTA